MSEVEKFAIRSLTSDTGAKNENDKSGRDIRVPKANPLLSYSSNNAMELNTIMTNFIASRKDSAIEGDPVSSNIEYSVSASVPPLIKSERTSCKSRDSVSKYRFK